MVVVHEIEEGLQSALSIDLLFAHALDNTAARAFNADHEGVSELLVLNETLVIVRKLFCLHHFVLQ